MAKGTKKVELSDGVQLVSDTLETKLKGNLKRNSETVIEEDLGEVTIVKEEPKVIPQKMVKILMREDHRCYVGGEWYYLLKGKHYNVPENVKSILLNADKLLPI